MKKWSTFTILTILSSIFLVKKYNDFDRDDNVISLEADSFNDALDTHNYLFVKFYTTWCSHCKSLAPEFSKAAAMLKAEGSEIQLAQVDAEIEEELKVRFHITGFPVLKLFVNGTETDYSGSRSAEDMVKWLKKKIGPASITVSSSDELEKLQSENEVFVLGLFKDLESRNAKVFNNVSRSIDHISFGIVSDQNMFEKLNVDSDEAVIVLKKFEEGRDDFNGKFDENEIKKFVHSNQFPIISELIKENSQKIFTGPISVHNFLIVNRSSSEFQHVLDEYAQAAKKFKGQVIFVWIDAESKENENFFKFIGLNKESAPTVVLLSRTNKILKFKLDETSEITSSSVEKFVQDVLENKTSPFYLSEELPSDWDAKPVRVLVRSNFVQVARDKTKTVLVEFYAPWCGHCQKLAPIYEQLGDAFNDKPEFVIAKIDSTKNELIGIDDEIEIPGYPTLLLFPKDSDEVIKFNGKPDLKTLSEFVNLQGKVVS